MGQARPRLTEHLFFMSQSSTLVTSNTNREEDEEQYEELTRSEGGMPSGTGDHELEDESVDPGYGDDPKGSED